MNRFARCAVSLLLCASMLTLVVVPAASLPLEAESVTVLADASTDGNTASADIAANVTGTGFWKKFACVGCMAGILAASGTGSIVAVAAVVALAPEVGTLCAFTCVVAFGGE